MSNTLQIDPQLPSQSYDEGDERFLTPKEAAAYLRVSKSYLDKLRVYGGGPKFLRFGKRKILYRKSDLDFWPLSAASVQQVSMQTTGSLLKRIPHHYPTSSNNV